MYKSNAWYEPTDSWYEPEERIPDPNATILDDAGDLLKSIVKRLYSKDNLEPLMLERDLDDLCHLLKVRLLDGDLQIERKKENHLWN